jgi:phosphatidate cytidylyltransferase
MTRIISAVIFLPVLIAAIWIGSPVYFCVLVGVAAILGLVEYYALTDRVGARSHRVTGLLAAAAILPSFYYGKMEWIVIALTALVIVELTAHLFFNNDLKGAVTASAATVFGVVWIAMLGGYLIAIRIIESSIPQLSAKLLSLFFLIVFAGDTGAYYVGRAIGRNKLAPRISPGKTIEGAIGGLLANIVVALVAHYTFFPELRLSHAIALAVVMGILGQIGDLCESMLKRGAEAKDAGQLIPGHGGLLDRLDSILFNAPVLYYFYNVFF